MIIKLTLDIGICNYLRRMSQVLELAGDLARLNLPLEMESSTSSLAFLVLYCPRPYCGPMIWLAYVGTMKHRSSLKQCAFLILYAVQCVHIYSLRPYCSPRPYCRALIIVCMYPLFCFLSWCRVAASSSVLRISGILSIPTPPILI